MNHFSFLRNGGLDPATAEPSELRERRTYSATAFLVILVAIGLIITNYFTGDDRNILPIAGGVVVVYVSLYLQAYLNQRLLAIQIPITAFWGVIAYSMLAVGMTGNTWVWLLCLPVIATLIAGRTAGVVWAFMSMVTLWMFAYQHYRGYIFPLALEPEGFAPLIVATEATLVLLMLSAATFAFRNAQMKSDAKLTSTVRQLEKEVHDRALAENEARQSEASKSAFLAAMSHELRTPLNGVIGASQLLADGSLPGKKQELVDVVLQSSETLLELINNVMDLTRLDENSVRFEEVSVDLRELVKAALAPLSFQAREKDVGFDLTIEDDVPQYVIGDPTRIRQVVLNLTGNAVKFTSTGEIKVVIDTALERIRIKVIDTGIGISKEAQASLFEPYVQADVSTVRKFGGSGLGLTIVKKLVTAMDGKVVVNSVPGAGSTFTVFLPLEETDRPPPDKPEEEEIKLPRLSVVLADDNAINRLVLSRMLEEDGHMAVALTNGREVVEYLQKHDVNVVLMDLQMPVMDGVSATRKIRSLEGYKGKTPIIAVTGNVTMEDPTAVKAQGMDGFLTKPFRPSELRVALKEVLKLDGKQAEKPDDDYLTGTRR